MKTFVAAMLLSASLAGPAFAAGGGTASHYTCEGGGFSSVALRQEAAPCCKGLFGCPQLLSTTGLQKSKPANRT